jgi:predicted short-subunit dehydrogenase-like oxidoreductase (DUF2520 family)
MNTYNIGFIGAGKVGTTLGEFFKSKGFSVTGYLSKTLSSAQSAANATSSEVFLEYDKLVEKCNVIFITTPDDQIENVWNKLQKLNIKNLIFCHTSGSLTSEIFKGIDNLEAFGYSVHPLYAFAKTSENNNELEKSCFSVEGNSNKMDIIIEFMNKLGNKFFILKTDKKVFYHLSAVFVSNFVLGLFSIGEDFMKHCEVSEEDAMNALMPLVLANIDNIIKKGCIQSLTGPVERNDIGTVCRHLDFLPKQYKEIYIQLTAVLINIAKQKHPQRDYSILEQELYN